MRWTCPNCGKQIDFSPSQIRQTGGIVVCPQCLSSERVPLPEQTIPKPSTTTKQPPRTIVPKQPPTAKPATRPVAPKKPKRKKTKRHGLLAPMSAIGCLWRSVVFTLILLAVYIFVGWALNYV